MQYFPQKKIKTTYLLGLVSFGGVHSHIDHLIAILKVCKSYGVSPKLHLFTDGRDADPKSALEIFKYLNNYINEFGGDICYNMWPLLCNG